jgi:hypothetical protein
MKRDAIIICTAGCHLDNSRKRCNMTFRDPNLPTAFPQETEKERPTGDQT